MVVEVDEPIAMPRSAEPLSDEAADDLFHAAMRKFRSAAHLIPPT